MSALLLPLMLFALPPTVLADSWKDEGSHGRREYKEEYWDGNCKIKRKQDKDGEYEEELKCVPPRARHGRDLRAEVRAFQEEYREGDCRIKRKQDKNGEYEMERKCKPPRHDDYRPAPAYMVPAPPSIVIEPGMTVRGTVRIPQ